MKPFRPVAVVVAGVMAAPVAIEAGVAAIMNPAALNSAASTLAEGVGVTGTAIGAAGAAAKSIEGVAVQFGKVENQISHTFRHVEKAGFDRTAVQDAIKQNLSKIADSLSSGQYNGSVVVDGTKLDYSAFKLSDGTINVGRITPPKQ
jgi:hypothetical protein